MTVSTEISSNEYTGNGVTTDFDYKFRIFKASNLSVTTSDADGDNVVTLRLGTDYTVTDVNKSAGGKVILTKPLADKHQISIARVIPIVQETSFRNQGKFLAETHEDAFDYLTMLMQRLWGSLSLFLKRPSILANWFDAKGYRISNLGKPKKDSDAVDLGTMKDAISSQSKRSLRVDDMDIVALPKASERAGNVLTFDKDGKPIVVAPASGSAVDVLNLLASEKGAAYIDSGNLTVFKKYGRFGDGGQVLNCHQAIRDSDGYWYIFTGSMPHSYGNSHTDDWINVGLLNGHPVNSIENYGAVASSIVIDNSDSINECIKANFQLRRKTVAGVGEFFVAKSIQVLMGDHYGDAGTTIKGEGIASTIFTMTGELTESVIKNQSSVAAKYNLNMHDFSIYGNGSSLAAIDLQSDTSRVNLKGIRTYGCKRGLNIPKKTWVNSYVDMGFNDGEYGIFMDDSGTTNTFDEIFVHGTTKSAYRLRTSYSNVGSLAADNCTGESIYDFRFCGGLTVGSLGFEQPDSKFPLCVVNLDNSSNVHIDNIVDWNGTPTDGEAPFDLINLGNAKGSKIGGIDLTNTKGGNHINGSLVSGYDGDIEIGTTKLTGVSFKQSTREMNHSILLTNNKSTGTVLKRPYQKPLIAGGEVLLKGIGLPVEAESRKVPSIYSDSLKSPSFGSSSDDSWMPAPEIGDTFLCNDPWKYGAYAYVCVEKGSNIGTSKFGIVPCIIDSVNPPTEPASKGVQWYDGTENKLKFWNGSDWV
ncbi:hypothetical protein [Providencia alcalifaciens]|uniref:hypothetical protein n=1 Tax=Providencia alcalifaciens TaxID=126385 RepID=UPI0003E2153E|nr:hypothetical protein [Providencia alcalifaciens]ETS99812.1 hypothetical protein HMPREF1568_0496 [Providencia alcalifaciens PAL-3]EUD01314.1 hypothetical protein HMPREF1566_3085 [Providencia alcalifaciens PAL-1]